nr:uncharacterized protein LOC127332797 [Lolium perenne]
MDLEAIKRLLRSPRPSDEYLAGVKGFLDFAYVGKKADTKINCPCVKCVNRFLLKRDDVYGHLVCDGMLLGYTVWGCHGETAAYISANKRKRSKGERKNLNSNMHQLVHDAFGNADNEPPVNDRDGPNLLEPGPDSETQAFFDLLGGEDVPLWKGCELSKLSFLVLLFNIKSTNKWSNKSLNDLLAVLQQAIPNGKKLPRTFPEAKKIIRKLGLSYERIHVCEQDCQIFWKEKESDDFCSICGISRWKNTPDKTTLTKKERRKASPKKVLRYFPIKPRLKRLFMHKETAAALRWHDEEHTKDGALRHPVDSEAWKHINSKHPHIAADPRNIRFAMATDGFNPFGMMSSKHSCWLVVLIPYNLPPWLCMKASSIMLTLLIPGPSYPGKNFYVFMKPVYEELVELFLVGTRTYDASRDEMFDLYAVLLYTVSDYPGLAIVAGYSISSDFGCFPCRDETLSKRLQHGQKYCYMGHHRFLPPDHEFRFDAKSFDGSEEHRAAPIAYAQTAILDKIKSVKDFEKSKTWKCESGLFSLPYWDTNLLRHNLDIMHIEKNVCENIYGTLLGIDGKSKDILKARLDLEQMKIRKELHPLKKPNNKYYLPAASYNMSKKGKQQCCKVLHDIRVSDGFSGNISRCVNVPQGKISGLKSHDCHILIQQLLPLALRYLLPDNVTSVLFDLFGYFREVSAKVLYIGDLEKLEERIIMTLRRMEMIFPPGFFTVMVHLVIHLATEPKIGGPVCYRSMWFTERYLGKLKSNVRTKAHPEGSIAEAYLADECMTFCSRYIVGFETKHNLTSRNEDSEELVGHCDVTRRSTLFPHAGNPLGKPGNFVLRGLDKVQAHIYVLFNCSDVNSYLRAHADEITHRRNVNLDTIERTQNEKFHEWFRAHIKKLEEENGINSIKNDIRCWPGAQFMQQEDIVLPRHSF